MGHQLLVPLDGSTTVELGLALEEPLHVFHSLLVLGPEDKPVEVRHKHPT